MAKSKKRARAMQAKRQRKASMKPTLDHNGNPIGQSDYAKKKRGEIPTTPRTKRVWCACHYRKECPGVDAGSERVGKAEAA